MQTELQPKDRNQNQLYWRREEEEPIEKYQMNSAFTL